MILLNSNQHICFTVVNKEKNSSTHKIKFIRENILQTINPCPKWKSNKEHVLIGLIADNKLISSCFSSPSVENAQKPSVIYVKQGGFNKNEFWCWKQEKWTAENPSLFSYKEEWNICWIFLENLGRLRKDFVKSNNHT
jgi:hypothetical protein